MASALSYGSVTSLPLKAIVALLPLLVASWAGSSHVTGQDCSIQFNNYSGVVEGTDIYVPAFTSLNLDCSVSENSSHGNRQLLSSSQNLHWKVNSTYLPKSKVQAVNQSTLRYQMVSSELGRTLVSCIYCTPDDTRCPSEKTKACAKAIHVGHPPLLVTNFECFSYNIEYISCSFLVPFNGIKQDASLTLNYFDDPERSFNMRLHTSKKSLPPGYEARMMFNESYPLGSTFYDKYWFEVTSTNKIGSSKQRFQVLHKAIVIPTSPQNFTVTAVDVNTISLRWSHPRSLNVFIEKLIYRIQYQSQWNSSDEWQNITVGENIYTYTLSGLTPYCTYNIRLSCLSNIANPKDERFWSFDVKQIVRTSATVPPPIKVVNGSFHQIERSGRHRDVTLYWQRIPRSHYNGPNFRYVIHAYSNNQKIGSHRISSPVLPLSNLLVDKEYRFTLYSENDAGPSVNQETVVVPSGDKHRGHSPEPVPSLTTVAYEDGVYELSWMPPFDQIDGTSVHDLRGRRVIDRDVEEYAVFWCPVTLNYKTCEEGVKFRKIHGLENTKTNITVKQNGTHRFAVSAIRRDGSSYGMHWSTCIVVYNQPMGKMKVLSVLNIDEKSVTVGWSLDCAEKVGSIIRFMTFWCETNDTSVRHCQKGFVENDTVDPLAEKYVISGKLKPNTLYRITIAAVTNNGIGDESYPLFVRTSEDAPTDAPTNVLPYNITNSSFTLSWSPPSIPNGNIASYKCDLQLGMSTLFTSFLNASDLLQYQFNELLPYRNYTIRLAGCTLVKDELRCGPDTNGTWVVTDVAEPLKMMVPDYRQNESMILVKPVYGDDYGPRNKFQVDVKWLDTDQETVHTAYRDLELPYQCGQDGTKGVTVRTKAVYESLVRNVTLEGEWSDPTTIACSSTGLAVHLVVTMVIVGALVLTFFFMLFIYCGWSVVDVYQKMKNIQIVLPRGFENGLDPVKPGGKLFDCNFPKTTSGVQDLGQRLDPRNRQKQQSGSTDVSHTSSDRGLITNEKVSQKCDFWINPVHTHNTTSGGSSTNESLSSVQTATTAILTPVMTPKQPHKTPLPTPYKPHDPKLPPVLESTTPIPYTEVAHTTPDNYIHPSISVIPTKPLPGAYITVDNSNNLNSTTNIAPSAYQKRFSFPPARPLGGYVQARVFNGYVQNAPVIDPAPAPVSTGYVTAPVANGLNPLPNGYFTFSPKVSTDEDLSPQISLLNTSSDSLSSEDENDHLLSIGPAGPFPHTISPLISPTRI